MRTSGTPVASWNWYIGLVDWPPALAALALAGYFPGHRQTYPGQKNSSGTGNRTSSNDWCCSDSVPSNYAFLGRPPMRVARGYRLLRFLILPFMVGISLLSTCYPKKQATRFLWIGSSIAGVAAAWEGTDIDGLLALFGVLLLGTFTPYWGPPMQRLTRNRPEIKIIALTSFLVVLGLLEPLKRQGTAEYLFEDNVLEPGIGLARAQRTTAKLPDCMVRIGGSKILSGLWSRISAYCNSGLGQWQAFLGRARTMAEGRVCLVATRGPLGVGMRQSSRTNSWKNLVESRAEYVFVSRVLERPWPKQPRSSHRLAECRRNLQKSQSVYYFHASKIRRQVLQVQIG